MAVKVKRTRRVGKRVARRRKPRNPWYGKITRAIAPRAVTGPPDQQVVTLQYTLRRNLNTGQVGTPVAQFMRGNSIFDPDASTPPTQHQPMWHDTYKQFYQYYKVTSSSIEVKFLKPSTMIPQSNGIVWVRPQRSTGLAPITETELERPLTKKRIIQGNGRSVTIKHWSSSKKQLPEVPAYTTTQFESDPQIQWFWVIGLDGLVPGTDTSVDLVITVKYRVQMMQRVLTFQS